MGQQIFTTMGLGMKKLFFIVHILIIVEYAPDFRIGHSTM